MQEIKKIISCDESPSQQTEIKIIASIEYFAIVGYDFVKSKAK